MAESLVTVEGLGKTYGVAVPTRALDDVSFTIGGAEFVSIIGRSGSGKSTLLNLIGLLDTPTDGRLLLDGNDAGTLGKDGRSRLRNSLLGFVFQFHYLLPEFSVRENLTMPARIAGKPADKGEADYVEELLSMLGLEGLADKNANDLSGGQKQRVAIGRALMNRPGIVLADEPTGNLDTENTEAVYDLFRTFNEQWGTTFVIVTHDQAIAQRTDRIIEIRDGRLLQDVRNMYGTPVRLLGEDLPAEG
jgi:lipoprotein-releasing system ATP-binding protein